jgi:hypothetical protein
MRKFTFCYISEIDGTPRLLGQAVRRANEPHVKEIARRVALTDALKDQSRAFRVTAWAAYNNRKTK